jgi:hypothetical protein
MKGAAKGLVLASSATLAPDRLHQLQRQQLNPRLLASKDSSLPALDCRENSPQFYIIFLELYKRGKAVARAFALRPGRNNSTGSSGRHGSEDGNDIPVRPYYGIHWLYTD